MRIGILGGTFDPPHIGHLMIAEEARGQLELARVIFIPAPTPPHKLDQQITPLSNRVEMLRLALGNNPFFTLSMIEAERAGPSYTVDTIRELRADFPPDTELFFVMGMDSLAQLTTWHEPGQLIQLCTLAVLKRPGFVADVKMLEEQIPGLSRRVVFVRSTELALSAHDLRERARAGQSLKYLVPDGVGEYVEEKGLYRKL